MLTQRVVSGRAHVRAEMPPREAGSAGWKLHLTVRRDTVKALGSSLLNVP